ncbi:MAG: (2Fe-2S)-binding protein [Acidobacteria bacterium]|nr:(2Fe-2S)-binding protein [Acidobacteriota bacterium]MCB9377723.1 (2Fe-2S)-binding protein [Holophagales bacterium]
MNGNEIELTVDGRKISARPGQTILEATEAAGIYVPRLCFLEGLSPSGSCRVCVVRVNGRVQSACTQPVAAGQIVENDTEELRALRRQVLDMLFVEGNHFCMFCEKSGNCELQALAYRFGITAPEHPFLFPRREVDASHPDLVLDRNRCILCGRCVRASRELDDKGALGFVGRGPDKRLDVGCESGLAGAGIAASDRAAAVCPTGALLPKRVGYVVPVGRRRFDHDPIGSEVEAAAERK